MLDKNTVIESLKSFLVNRLLSAIWLLACDADNTARLALKGGLQILVVSAYSCHMVQVCITGIDQYTRWGSRPVHGITSAEMFILSKAMCLRIGSTIVQGILNFADKTCYVPLKTLVVGTLCTMCRFEPDVGALGMQLNLASTLLQAVYSNTSTSYLKVIGYNAPD